MDKVLLKVSKCLPVVNKYKKKAVSTKNKQKRGSIIMEESSTVNKGRLIAPKTLVFALLQAPFSKYIKVRARDFKISFFLPPKTIFLDLLIFFFYSKKFKFFFFGVVAMTILKKVLFRRQSSPLFIKPLYEWLGVKMKNCSTYIRKEYKLLLNLK